MRKIVSFLITLALGALAVSFAVSNRQPVEIGLWPLPFSVETGLFLAIFLAFLAGFVAGGAIMWVSDGRVRAQARKRGRAMRAMESKIVALEKRDATRDAKADTDGLPAPDGAPPTRLAG